MPIPGTADPGYKPLLGDHRARRKGNEWLDNDLSGKREDG